MTRGGNKAHMDAMRSRRTYSREDPLTKLLRKIDVMPSGCWVFTGRSLKNGYPVIGTGKSGWFYGHRLAYERLVGPIPADRPQLHHQCEQPLCVNPDHLVPSTAVGHARQHGLGAGPCRTCGEDDWYVRPDTGARQCRECKRRRRRDAC